MKFKVHEYVTHVKGFLSKEKSSSLFSELLGIEEWRFVKRQIGTSTYSNVDVRRRRAFFYDGDTYEDSAPWTTGMRDLLSGINGRFPADDFNSAQANLYKVGDDSIGWHADDNTVWAPTSGIAIVGLGSGRALMFRPKNDHKDVTRVFIGPGDVVYMKPNTQQLFEHCLARQRGNVKPRISVVFRRLQRL